MMINVTARALTAPKVSTSCAYNTFKTFQLRRQIPGVPKSCEKTKTQKIYVTAQ